MVLFFPFDSRVSNQCESEISTRELTKLGVVSDVQTRLLFFARLPDGSASPIVAARVDQQPDFRAWPSLPKWREHTQT